MGATSADTQREIEEIRKDVSSAVGELEVRLIHAASPQTYLDCPRESSRSVGMGLAGLGVAGAFLARAFVQARKRNRPSERLRRTVQDVAEGLGEQLGRAASIGRSRVGLRMVRPMLMRAAAADFRLREPAE